MKNDNIILAYIFSIIIILLFAGFFAAYIMSLTDVKTVKINTNSGVVEINIEVADDPQERQTGLMFRESLPEDTGMLFYFTDEQPRSFWMKNTLIPLDIIFISSEMKIVDIMQLQPCENDPCQSYTSKAPARYVLEVNAGFVEKNNIDIGNTVSIE